MGGSPPQGYPTSTIGIGDAVTGGGNNRILHIGPTGLLASTANFTYVSETGIVVPAGEALDSASGSLVLKAAGTTAITIAATTITTALPILAPNGTAGAPSFSYSADPDTGIFGTGTNAVGIATAGSTKILVDTSRLFLLSTQQIAWESADAFSTVSLALVREAAAVLQMGVDVNGAAVHQTFKAHDGITGTDVAGASMTFAPGRGTGAGTGASLIFSTSTTLATGTTAQTLVARLTLSQGVVTTDAATLTFADRLDMVFNATTGTKIGTATTQKLSFWNATPVVQPTNIVDADGTLADITTKFNSLLTKLETIGILAA